MGIKCQDLHTDPILMRSVEGGALWPVRALGDPSAQFPNLVLRQPGELLPLADWRHFEVFHLILHETEQWAGVGFTGNDDGFAPLATLEQRTTVDHLESALGSFAAMARHAGAFKQG